VDRGVRDAAWPRPAAHLPWGDDVGARNELERFLAIESQLDYEGVARVLGRWRPYAGRIYLHLLLDSLSETGLVTP
jgi:3-methyladenine DNA glycosylase/8-oxoguanine DNA glycosylase